MNSIHHDVIEEIYGVTMFLLPDVHIYSRLNLIELLNKTPALWQTSDSV